MRRIWAGRLAWLTGAAMLTLAPIGCGTSTVALLTGDPPGRLIAGTGAVADAAAADLRVLLQYLGLAANRQGGARVGTGADPLDTVYRLQAGTTPADTRIRPFFDDEAYQLNRDYFVYFVDPSPNQEFEHEAFLLYVRPSDGAIFEQSVQSFPVVNDQIRLQADADRLENLVYVHEIFEDLVRSDRQVAPPPLVGAKTGALILAGSAEGRRQADIDNAAHYLQDLTGEANPLSVLWHKHPDEIDKQDFIDKLAETSEGLGPDDKYFLVIASHGGAPPTSRFQVGTERMTYAELCEAIENNVTAGHVNILSGTCYGGQMHDVFLDWAEKTSKSVHWWTATPSDKPGYADPPGNWGLKCAFDKLTMALETARENGVVTLAEIEKAMDDIEVTGDEILQKICDYYEPKWGPGAPIPDWKEDMKRDDGPGDKWPRPGDPRKGGFSGDNPPLGDIQIPEVFRFLPFDFGNGTGFLGTQNVELENGNGGIATSPFGIQFAPAQLEITSTLRLPGNPESFGTIHLGGPIVFWNDEGDDAFILTQSDPPIAAIPSLPSDPNSRVWAVRNNTTHAIELLFPRKQPTGLTPNETPLVSRLLDMPLSPIFAGPPKVVLPLEVLNNLKAILAVVNGGFVPPNGGTSQEIDQGLLLIVFNAENTRELAALATFDVGGAQSGLFWQTELPLQTAPIAGDFDGDGDVDAADYLVWQRHAGSTTAGDPADLDHSGVVDGDDLVIWRDHFTGSNPPAP